jgi:hypothetical protein
MPYYPDSETLNTVLNEMFQRTLSDPAALRDLKRSRMLFLLDISDPVAVVTVNSKAEPPSFKLGRTYSRPDLAIHTPMDVLHQVLLKEIRLREAYFGGSMKVDGSILQAKRLEDLFHHLQRIYPRVIRELNIMPGGAVS